MRPFNAFATPILLLALAVPFAPRAAFPDTALERAVAAKDPKAVQEVVAQADTADPLLLMLAAHALVEQGRTEQGIFWFYAGQLRARYWPKLQGENAQILTIYLMTLGEQVNARAFKDIPGLIKTLDAVVAWDERTYPAWAASMQLDPKDPALMQRRSKAIEGIGPYKKKLVDDRSALEEYARNYKTPAELEKERQEDVNSKYSTQTVVVHVAGTRFRLPANYLAPNGPVFTPDVQYGDMGFWVFLPDFGGYTRENWREPNANPNAILIRVRSEERRRPEAEAEEFLAQGGAPVERVGKLEATVYDSRKTHAPLPVIAASRHYVLKATRASGGPYYVICDAPRPGIVQQAPRCEMFLGDAARKLGISAFFRRDHLDRMAEIEAQLSSMLASWIVP